MKTGRIRLPRIDPPQAQKEIEDFIIRKVLEAGMRGGVVGLSGGVDSSTVALLTAGAFRKHAESVPGEDALALRGLILPAAANRSADREDAMEVAALAGIEYRIVEIQPLVDGFCEHVPDVVNNKAQLGNLSSETRAVVLSRHAAAYSSLVIGTGNHDEDYCLGYFTKRGDGAVDISPIGALSKRNVRILASFLGVPDRIAAKAPAAGLWEGQTDEGELGFTYEFAEVVIAGYEQGLSMSEIARETETDPAEVERVLAVHDRNSHKLQMPEIAPVTFLA